METQQKNHLQVAKPKQQSLVIYKGGSNIDEIINTCELSTVDFFNKTYHINKIKDNRYNQDFRNLIGLTMTKISVLAGLKGEIDNTLKHDISQMLFRFYSELTLEEIYKAFELERYGIYETKSQHFQFFSADYISDVLKKYKKWKVEEKIKLNFKVIQSPLLPSKTKSEIEKETILDVQSKYEEYLRTDNIEGITFYIFDFLVKKEKIIVNNTPTNIQWFKDRLKVAQKILSIDTSNKKATSKSNLIDIKQTLKQIEDRNSPIVLNKAKDIVLKEYFDKQADLRVTYIFD